MAIFNYTHSRKLFQGQQRRPVGNFRHFGGESISFRVIESIKRDAYFNGVLTCQII
jgi:hypothetical protein